MSVFILFKKKKVKEKVLRFIPYGNVQSGKMNFLSVCNSSVVTDTLQISSFCLEGCTQLAFVRRISDAETPLSIL